MTILYKQDDYIAEVKIVDVQSDRLGQSYLFEVVKTISSGWFGEYPEGSRFTAWKSSSIPTNWKLSFSTNNIGGNNNDKYLAKTPKTTSRKKYFVLSFDKP